VPLNLERKKRNYIQYLFINFLNSNKIMDKKELKFYEAPACDVVELNAHVALLAGSDVEGVEDPGDITGGNDDPGF
jgi:hypothetical protein